MRIVAALAALVLAFPVAAQRADTAYARVTYVSGTSVYIDAGERDGLAEGNEAVVVRAGATVAQLRVRFVSPARAQCEVLSATDAPVVGDSVRYMRAARPVAPDTAAVGMPAPTPVRRVARQERALHGRIGLRYLATFQRDSGAGEVSQPASDIRVNGTFPGLPSIELALDARGKRTRTVSIDGVVRGTRTSTLVYQSSIGWRSPSGPRVTVGRQYAPELASVSLFDGVLAGYDRPRFGGGVFAGTQPDASMGYSTTVREYGAYVSARAVPDAPVSWNVSSGAIGSYFAGQLDREFAFVTGSVRRGPLSAYVLQEVDYNRGWKRAAGESSLTPTSTYASASVRATEHVSVNAGYDNRRSARLYRNYVTPEIAFDDSWRTGVWGSLLGNFGRLSATLDARRSSGGAAGVASVFGASAFAGLPPRLPMDVRERTSWYDTPTATGWLHSLAFSVSPTPILRVEASGGARIETPRAGTAIATTVDRLTVSWLELTGDIAIARAWYAQLSFTRERGGWDSADLAYTSLSYRF